MCSVISCSAKGLWVFSISLVQAYAEYETQLQLEIADVNFRSHSWPAAGVCISPTKLAYAHFGDSD